MVKSPNMGLRKKKKRMILRKVSDHTEACGESNLSDINQNNNNNNNNTRVFKARIKKSRQILINNSKDISPRSTLIST